MTERLKGMKRILKVQDQLKRMADWRLAEAERASADIAEAKADLWRFIDADVLTGALAASALSQAARLDARGVAAARAVEAEAEAMRETTARQKLVARAVEDLGRTEAAAQERKDLERLIEGFVARTGVTSGGTEG